LRYSKSYQKMKKSLRRKSCGRDYRIIEKTIAAD